MLQLSYDSSVDLTIETSEGDTGSEIQGDYLSLELTNVGTKDGLLEFTLRDNQSGDE